MNRSIETRANISGHGGSRLWIGLTMLGGVVLSQMAASVVTGVDPLPRWMVSASAQQDGHRVESPERGMERPLGSSD